MLPKYLLINLCQANIQSGRCFCVLFLCQRPDRSDHAGGIDFYLLQRHCAAVDALQQVVIITLPGMNRSPPAAATYCACESRWAERASPVIGVTQSVMTMPW